MKHNQHGSINALLFPLILTVLLFIAAAIFGGWAYSSRQDYKNNTDQKIAVAVTAAKQQQMTQDNQTFAQEEKQPLKTYDGPESYGSIVVNFPKTWSAYVDDTGGSGTPISGYFYPGTVPAITGKDSIFALRVEVLSQSYSQALIQYTGEQQNNLDTIAPYSLPKVPSVVGVEVTGLLQDGKTGTAVILPLRSETLEIWTDSSQYLSDFNNNILPNFSFSP